MSGPRGEGVILVRVGRGRGGVLRVVPGGGGGSY